MFHFLLLNSGVEEGIVDELVFLGSLEGVGRVVYTGQVREREAKQPGTYAVPFEDMSL